MIVTLGIGIGANSVMFSVVNSLLLRAAALRRRRPAGRGPDHGKRALAADHRGAAGLLQISERNRSFESRRGLLHPAVNLTGGREPERLPTLLVSTGLFDALGTQMALGRGFVRQDEQWGSHRVAVLTTGLWERRFGGDPAAVGSTIALNGESFEVVGVLPPASRSSASTRRSSSRCRSSRATT